MASVGNVERLRWNRALTGAAAGLALLGMMLWLAGWTGSAGGHRGVDAVLVAAGSLPWAAGWLLAAAGLGWPLRILLVRDGGLAGTLAQVALGVAAMLSLDAAFGRLGLLQWAGNTGAWGILVAGAALTAAQLFQSSRLAHQQTRPIPWLAFAALPAIAVLVLAACSAPGWLWGSEFGGYDALSYHLQLPKEWLARGRIGPLEHNVYSYLPGYMEGAYYHLDVLMGGAIEAAYTCQLLHALLTILAALLVGQAAKQWSRDATGGELAGPIAAAIFLGTPWIIVVGSLAYNEMTATAMLAAGMLIVGDRDASIARRAIAIGLLAGAACGAKLTSVGFVAAPLLVILAASAPPRRWPLAFGLAGSASLLVLLPWLIGNCSATGNPVFPFATSLFGLGHWTAEQAAAFAHGHMPGHSLTARLSAAWDQLIRYGIGPNPVADEPWKPQWSVLPWLALAGLVVGTLNRSHRRQAILLGAVIAMQVLFWLTLTHVKSRFMVPAAAPSAMLVACGFTPFAKRLCTTLPGRASLFALIVGWCCVPAAIFRTEAHESPAAQIGMATLIAGDELTQEQSREVASAGGRAPYLNRALSRQDRVLLVGDATPFYYRGTIVYQTTWDRGPLSGAMREHPDKPQAWIAELRGAGFTHMLVDPAMLRRWESSGWNDPLITAARVTAAADQYARVELRFPDGATLYRLAPAPTGSASQR